MKFNVRDRRLEGDTLLRQCQLTEVYLLDVFVEICKLNKLRYFLCYGTLLGAMRHNGFIPWDDDVDVSMPEEDYEKFRHIASDYLPENIMLDDPREIKGEVSPIIRLRDRSSFTMCASTVAGFPSGIYMDIYPLVKFPKLPRRFSRFLVYCCSETWLNVWIHRTKRHYATADIFLSWLKAMLWQILRLMSVFLLRFLRLVRPNVWHGPLEIGLPFVSSWNSCEVPDSVIFPLRTHVFEGREYNVPNNPDVYLTQIYGNWRELPPVEKRVWHHSIICPTQAPDEWWAKPYLKK